MFVYPSTFEESKRHLSELIEQVKRKGRHVFEKKIPITDELSIDQITILAKDACHNRLILSTGLHGIEGYVGHAAIADFLQTKLDLLDSHTECIILHGLNPFGMKHFRRTNENNVDLNRNFSQNEFTSENPGYQKVRQFFVPKKYKNKWTANTTFYGSLAKLIIQYGIPVLKEATLLGQNSYNKGIYFGGTSYQNTTKYIIEFAKKSLDNVRQVVWIDLHTGYGPRYQMSIVNSKYETDETTKMKETFTYPLILGLNADDFYDIDGDMIEYLYHMHSTLHFSSSFYGTCFEFGTFGDSTPKTIESLKAMIFENASFFSKQSNAFHAYATELIKKQFLPEEVKWRDVARQNFDQAIREIITYKNI